MRVLIADDQPLARAGIRAILESEAGIDVVAEAGDGDEAVAAATEHRPDIVMMDVQMPGLDGLAATRRLLSAPETRDARVLVLTTFGTDANLYEALRAGASGFLLKDMPPGQLVAAVRSAHAGDALVVPDATRRLIAEHADATADASPPPGWEDLTEREREVFLLVARGRSNAEIMAELVVTEATVKTHVGRIFMKLGLRDRVQAVIAGYESGLVRRGEW